jgi:hypothetical protein
MVEVESYLVLLQQILDTASQASDGLVLVIHHCFQVELQVVERDSVLLEAVLGVLVQVRRVKQSFGRDAPDIQACTTQSATRFNTCRLFSAIIND